MLVELDMTPETKEMSLDRSLGGVLKEPWKADALVAEMDEIREILFSTPSSMPLTRLANFRAGKIYV